MSLMCFHRTANGDGQFREKIICRCLHDWHTQIHTYQFTCPTMDGVSVSVCLMFVCVHVKYSVLPIYNEHTAEQKQRTKKKLAYEP